VPGLYCRSDWPWRPQEHPAHGYDRLHHFIGAGIWDSAPLEATLWQQADALVGGDKAWLIIDDTALPKKGKASVGVAPQYATVLGKNANCQTMVSVTLASGEVPVMLSLRLFLPESWTSDAARMVKAGVPDSCQSYRTKPELAIEEIDRVIAAGVRFGCVLADAGYGLSASFRQALSMRDLCWASEGLPRRRATDLPDRRAWASACSACARRQILRRPCHACRCKMVPDQLASWDKESPHRALCRCPRADRGWRATAYRHRRSTAYAWRGGLAGGRASLEWRAKILSVELACEHTDQGGRRRNQGTLDLRTGASATQGRTRSRPF
jgi:hypothetical protein